MLFFIIILQFFFRSSLLDLYILSVFIKKVFPSYTRGKKEESQERKVKKKTWQKDQTAKHEEVIDAGNNNFPFIFERKT